MRIADRGVVFLDIETTPPILQAVAAAAGLYRRYAAHRQRLADRQLLTRLGDRELKDLGLYRSDLDRVMNGRDR